MNKERYEEITGFSKPIWDIEEINAKGGKNDRRNEETSD